MKKGIDNLKRKVEIGEIIIFGRNAKERESNLKTTCRVTTSL